MKPILQIEYFFEKVYKAAETSKALALGKDGSWAATWGMASSSDAAEQAIRDCQNAYAREFPDSGNDDGCKIVAIDEEVKVPEAVDSGQWQKALSGEDKPFQAGIHMTQTRGGKPRGVFLAVHGCDGVGSELFNEAWGKYFNALGFDYHAPDSFADERPKAVCG